MLAVATLFGAGTAHAATFNYVDNAGTGSTAIGAGTSCAAPLVRTINVTDSYAIGDVKVGFVIQHAYRGDVQITVTSPGGTSVQVVTSSGADNNINWNIELDDASGNPLDNNLNHSTAATPYQYTVSPSNALSAFDGENVNGTWTFSYCDTFTGADDGNLLRAELIIEDTSGPPSGPAVSPAVGTVINSYAKVNSIAGSVLGVSTTTGFTAGSRALIIQMQGSTVTTTDNASHGDITAYNSAGRFEYVEIASAGGGTITLASPPTVPFNTGGSVQIVSVPVYNSTTIASQIVPQPWNGDTGGVVALDDVGTLTLSSGINATGHGFRGGALATSIAFDNCLSDQTNYTSAVTAGTGNKGEGIIANAAAHAARRGHRANGGGGGNITDAGGGGGGNVGAGGVGGRRLDLCDSTFTPVGGLGGQGLSYAPNNRVFMGGGGGSGSEVGQAPVGGARSGGGIIMVRANNIVSTGGFLVSQGLDAASDNSNGADGGAAAGSIVVSVVGSITGSPTADVSGGDGGDESNPSFAHGTGGGGGGGAIRLFGTTCAFVSPIVNGGSAGMSTLGAGIGDPTWGAAAGGPGDCAGNFSEIGLVTQTDYSDAPTSGTAPSGTGTNAYGDATHTITAGIQLGAAIDGEAASLASATANGDDTNATDDEDGVSTVPDLTEGDTSYTIPSGNFTATGTGTLHGWMDFDGNGTFDNDEHTSVAVTTGTLAGDLTWSFTDLMSAGTTFARFRFTSDAGVTSATPATSASDGEVEDYQVTVAAPYTPTLPTQVCRVNYASWTFVAASGPTDAEHIGTAFVDSFWTFDGDNLPQRSGTPDATGTLDLQVSDQVPELTTSSGALDGETHLLVTRIEAEPGSTRTVTIEDPAAFEHQIFAIKDSSGNLLVRSPATGEHYNGTATQTLSVTVPGDGILYVYNWVVDFDVAMRNGVAICEDYGDAPASYGDAGHATTLGLYLGSEVPDLEGEDQNTASGGTDGTGDDTDTDGNDEDGVSTVPDLTVGDTGYTIPSGNITATGTGTLHGWVDFDGNGTFDSDEHTSVAVTTGTLASDLTWSFADLMSAGTTYARFRFTSDAGVTSATPASAASDGEVEDYQVTVAAPLVLFCPLGYTLGTAVPDPSTADSVVAAQTTAVDDFTPALGSPAAAGSPASNANGVRIRGTNGEDTLTLDMGQLLPENAVITLSMGRLSVNAAHNMTVRLSDDGVTYTDVLTFTDATEDTYEVVNVLVPAGGARYIQYQRNTGTFAINGLNYSDICIATGNDITGTIFEDAQYGGGAGRDYATADGAFANSEVGGVEVELYESAGLLVTSTFSAADGSYSFTGLSDGDYYVRVVNSSVQSQRPGTPGGLIGVQTFRTDGTTDVTNEVGGRDPSVVDTGPNTGGSLNTGTFALDGGQAQSVQPVTISGADVTGVDFGFNFSTIVNTNDTGQGSLRQFIDNSNALTNGGLAQNGLTAGTEHTIFMVPAGDLTAGVALIDVATALPRITDTNTAIDGTTQTTNIGNTNTASLGTATSVGTDSVPLAAVAGPEVQVSHDAGTVGIGFETVADNTTFRGLAIRGFNQDHILAFNTAGLLIEQNAIGINATSSADPGGILRGGEGVDIDGTVTATIQDNYFDHMADDGIASGAGLPNSTVVIQRNHIINRGYSGVGSDRAAIDLFGNTSLDLTVTGNYLEGPSGALATDWVASAQLSAGTGVERYINNTVINGSIGIAASATGGTLTSTIDRNVVSGASTHSISTDAMGGDINATITDNSVSNTGSNGIWLNAESGSSSTLIVRQNTVTNSTDVGIGAQSETGAIVNLTFDQNQVTTAGQVGILALGSSGAATLNGTITDNTVDAAGVGGIAIADFGGSISGAITVSGNTVINGGSNGILANAVGMATTISQNSVYDNGGLGIDLAPALTVGDGVTANDAGDGDAGANDLLNFPVFTSIATDGTANISYDFDLDVPTGSYVVEFFLNTTIDPSGHGEGETYLGSVTVSEGNSAGTFAANQSVPAASNALITATATSVATGKTSEFSAPAPAGNDVSGTIFEDAQYGGGAGRDYATADAVFASSEVGGATIELYDNAGALVSSTTTAADGTYSFTGVADGDYYVRVVNDTVESQRTGSNPALIGVQTFRTDGTTDVTGEVGGRDPSTMDAIANTGAQTLDTVTFLMSSGNQAQSVQPVTVAGSAVSGVDFGFNFSTIVNTNDSDQGSFRQFIENSNALSNSGLNQALPVAITGYGSGDEVSIFMIPSASDPFGRPADPNFASGVAVIDTNGFLSAISESSTHIDGRTQTVNVGNTNSTAFGISTSVGTDSIALSQLDGPEIQLSHDSTTVTIGLALSATDLTVRNIALRGFAGSDILALAGSSVDIRENIIGMSANSTADPGGSLRSESAVNMSGAGITAVIENNVIDHISDVGLVSDGSASLNATIRQNQITNPGYGTDHATVALVGSAGLVVVADENYLVGTSADVNPTFGVIGAAAPGTVNATNNTTIGGQVGLAVSSGSSGLTATFEKNISQSATQGGFAGSTVVSGSTITMNVRNNQVPSGVHGFFFNYITDGNLIADVSGNDFTNLGGVGALINGNAGSSTMAGSITNNSITNPGLAGIGVTQNSSSITGELLIQGNSITGVQPGGIGGIGVNTDGPISILQNDIESNAGLGIDLQFDGVTANDAGDGDTGANSLINFPVINSISADGTTSMGYNFNVDLPGNAEGYRIEMYRDNVSGDTHGEGAEYLGAVTIAHGGGDLNFTGTLASALAISTGDNITMTTTRIDSGSASGFAETSEFSETLLVAPLDYSDAPLSYGDATHTIVAGLQLGTVAPDADTGSLASANADGDDAVGDDETTDVAFNRLTLPSVVTGATEYRIPTVAVENSTGSAATVYAWADFDNNGTFDADEVTTFAVANGTATTDLFALEWSSIPAGFAPAGTQMKIRLRITTDSLVDNGGTAVDERSFAAASDGEVEDYIVTVRSPVNLSCALNPTWAARGFTGPIGNSLSSIDISTGVATDHYDAWQHLAIGKAANGNLYYPEFRTGTQSALIRFDGTTATVAGTLPVSGLSILRMAVGTNGIGYFTSGNDLYRFDTNAGTVVSTNLGTITNAAGNAVNLSGGSGDMAIFSDGTILIVESNGNAFTVDPATLEAVYRGQFTGATIGSIGGIFLANDGTVYLGSSDLGTGGALYSATIDIGTTAWAKTQIGGSSVSYGDLSTCTEAANPFGEADLSLTKVVDNASVSANQTVTFTLTVTNDGPAAATGVQVTDLLPAGLTYVSDNTASNGVGDDTGGAGDDSYDDTTGLWIIPGSIANGASVSLEIVAQVAAGMHTNEAAITASDLPDPDSDPATGAGVDDLGDSIADDDEASVTVTALNAVLAVSKTSDVYDPTTAGLFAIPGNDMLYTITVTNTGDGPADSDSVLVIDALPPEIEFYNGDIDDGGPETNPIAFSQTGGAGLTLTYGTDVAFSDQATAPTGFAGCTYTPSAGYDPNVTFICINPKGAMAAGDPDPTFTLQLRGRIK